MKTCNKCQERKTLGEYHRDKSRADGYREKCKECSSILAAARYIKNRKKRIQTVKRHYYKNRESLIKKVGNWAKLNPEKRKAILSKYNVNNRLKVVARNILNTGLRNGFIEKKPCQVCGNKTSQAHHDDYSKPLTVTWLCNKHHMAWHRVFIAVCFLVVLFPTLLKAEPYKFTFANDFFARNGKDRWLTNQMMLEVGAWGLSNEMYTPKDKRSKELPDGDRPYDGYSFIQYTKKWEIAQGERNILKSRIGTLGEWSGSREIQTWFHDDMGWGVHPEWVGQNPPAVALDFILSRQNVSYLQSVFGDTSAITEYGARVGNVVDELFLDQELRKHFFKYLYIFGGIRGQAVLFNTHLDGRLIDEHLIKGYETDVYTVDKQPFVASARLGVELYFPQSEFFISYTYKYLTEEFKGQDGRHLYGSIELGTKF